MMDNASAAEVRTLPHNTAALVKSITTISVPGSAERKNEDSVYVNPDAGIAGVFDGASDITGFRTTDGRTGGTIASAIAAQTLETAGTDASLTDIMLEANRAIDEAQVANGLDTTMKEARFCTTAAIARVRREVGERPVIDLLQIADSVALVVYTDGRAEAPLGLIDQDEETLALWKEMVDSGMAGPDIRQHPRMINQIQFKRSESNVTYGVLNGEPDLAKFIQSTTIPATGVSKIILLTDGIFIPKKDVHADHNWFDYARIVESGGLALLMNHIREIEVSDPDRVVYPRLKMSDDATAVVIQL